MTTLTPENKKKLVLALKEMSASMARMDAERDLQKNVKKDICDELDLSKKVFSKLAKTYHKGNFPEEQEVHEEFETLYETVTSSNATSAVYSVAL